MKKQRKHYTPEEKVAILRRHLLEHFPISELCDKHGLQPTVFNPGPKEFFENGAAAFQPKARPNHSAEQERIDHLEKKIQTKDEVLAELMAEQVALRKVLGNSDRGLGSRTYAGPDRGFRPALVRKTEIGAGRLIEWLNITASKFYDWRERYGKVIEHNRWVPRDFWLADWEKQAIIGFHLKNPLEGYRRLTFVMLDADIVAVSPTSVWRVLGQAGLLSKWNGKPSKKGTGFEQPLGAHEHWHRRVVHQHQRNVLSPLQHSGRLQPIHRELGSAGVDDRGGH